MTEQEREMLRIAAASWLVTENGINHVWATLHPWGNMKNLKGDLQMLAERGRLEFSIPWMVNTMFSSGDEWSAPALLMAGGEGTEESEKRVFEFVLQLANDQYRTDTGKKKIRKLLADQRFVRNRVQLVPPEETDGPVYAFDSILTKYTGKDENGEMLLSFASLVGPDLPIPMVPIPLKVIRAAHNGIYPVVVPPPPDMIFVSEQRVLEVSESARNSPEERETAIQDLFIDVLYTPGKAAMVLNLNPLIIAAYSEKLDCVAVLKYTATVNLVEKLGLQPGSRLYSVNIYYDEELMGGDLIRGPKADRKYKNFAPVIAEFISNDFENINAKKLQIPETEWQRCWDLGNQYLREHPAWIRNGDPFKSGFPSDVRIEEIKSEIKSDLKGGCFKKIAIFAGIIIALPFIFLPFINKDSESLEEAQVSPTPVVEEQQPETPLPTANSCNDLEALAIAELVSQDLTRRQRGGPPFAVAAKLEGDTLTVVARAMKNVNGEHWLTVVNDVTRRAVRVRGMADNTTVQTALLNRDQPVGFYSGQLSSKNLEPVLQSTLPAPFTAVIDSFSGFRKSADLSDSDREWVSENLPNLATIADRGEWFYSPDPGRIFRSWRGKNGLITRAKFQRSLPEGIAVWQNEGKSVFLEREKLDEDSLKVAERLEGGEKVPGDALPPIPQVNLDTISGGLSGYLTGGLIRNRIDRDWSFEEFGVVNGKLLSLGTKQEHDVILITNDTGKVNVMPMNKLDAESKVYLEKIRSGEEP